MVKMTEQEPKSEGGEMSKDMDKHLIPMGNGASQCKYCGASFLSSYTGQSPEPGVDEEWEKEFEEIVEAEDLSPSNRSALALDMVKQLLTHISTSGNNMSDEVVDK